MRIGIMLRSYDRAGGIGIYTRNIVKHILNIDQRNHYVLIYNNRDHLGSYAYKKNVDEVFVKPCNSLIWDHYKIPKVIKSWGIDLIFHTKFTVPITTNAKKVMMLHGSGWFVHPELWSKRDVFYQQKMMPLYCRKADYLISNSDLTTNDFIRIFGISEEKINTIYLAPGENFRPIKDQATLGAVRGKYNLPEKFILTVTSYDPARKNFDTLIDAFESLYKKHKDVHLVVAGKNCQKYTEDFHLRERGLIESVIFSGWVDQEDLPAIYTLAKCFVFPSVYETFGIPVLEALACGCPVVSSNTGAIPELAEGAAALIDPFDQQTLAERIMDVLESESVFNRFRMLGIERAKEFTWTKAAKKTLNIFESVHSI
jgi:glycosyltransferase involved in cell wall biosynthesis